MSSPISVAAEEGLLNSQKQNPSFTKVAGFSTANLAPELETPRLLHSTAIGRKRIGKMRLTGVVVVLAVAHAKLRSTCTRFAAWRRRVPFPPLTPGAVLHSCLGCSKDPFPSMRLIRRDGGGVLNSYLNLWGAG